MSEGIKISQLTDATAVNLTDTLPIVQSGTTLEATVELLKQTLIPAGFFGDFAGTTAPAGWLACDGSAVSRTTYAALFSAIGTTWGAGDGSTTFNLPDRRGTFARGAGSHGTETMANGSPFAGPAVGAFEDDQMQGHWHEKYVALENRAASTSAGANNIVENDASATNTVAGADDVVRNPTADGTNGTPRTGDETRPFAVGVLVCIKT
jgi:microcystin-dependent protein